ncbi:pyridoxamine 5'-phosphate oxidase family protein (plasmid) [Streptomyces sp. HUAS TT11]|uniref:pyridoxamine 5'-phosphate oxidase family protein n=1 Tax=Streptomyces sp. HUAS TT11 TaxID=3447508 RepID=UPI003F65BABD
MEITSEAELRDVMGSANPVVFDKAATVLGEFERRWLENAPFCLLATAGADGTCDVSPRGDPPGFALVLDDRTLALPDRPGNRRLDSWRNVLANPRVALIFVVPGRGDTLRINGTGRLLRDAPYFDRMAVRGKRPPLALEVSVEETYFHCARSFLRARLWEPATWQPERVPSRAHIARATEWRGRSLEELQRRYGPDYERTLY